MHHRRTAFTGVVMVALASLALAACGSSNSSPSGSPSTLLSQTFTGTHKVTSGVLNLTLTIDPSGSSTFSGPITLSFGGPFQTLGSGKLPESNFTVSASALGRSVSLGILSTGTSGYVTLQGVSYQMPQATFQRLESSFAQLASGAGGSSQNSGALAKLGIRPLQWLTHPSTVGVETVGGAQTDHIHAGVNVPSLLNDLNTFLEKASSVSNVAGASRLKSGLSATTRQKIAAAIRNPSFDVWTGTSDKTIRRLTIALTLPVTGSLSSQTGGVKSADIGLTMQYSELNQPQTITAPTAVRPYSEFQSKVSGFIQGLQGAASGVLGGTGSSGAGSSGSAGSSGGASTGGSSTNGSSSNVTKYSQCIQQANGDVAKMQKCASLLGSGG
ncbi:MAG: hypothetical protein JO027_16245 [Solirubrobacterales bacterium]|nr:hypothetical protein [Solirubrobacterales bacterium]